ncbi:MAG TPA: tail fiber domain-containing protein [Longimicrobium sp.]|nr:tail fiber domain-containing protein [Longimicrobium sp.]
MPPFVHDEKKSGDLIRSADWNLISGEVLRLGTDKISRAGEETLDGPLTVRGALTVGTGSAGGTLAVRGELTVGTANAGAAVRVLRKQEDGRAATDGALVLGTDSPSSAALRVGYYSTYSWLQGQGQQAIALNPHGGNVGIGTGTAAPAARLHVEGDARVGSLQVTANLGVGVGVPVSRLAVGGGASVGAGYAATAAPGDGLIVQGSLGIGIAAPAGKLHVNGDTVWSEKTGQRFILHARQNGAGDFVQLTTDDAAGNWEWGKGISLRRATGNVGIGTSDPQARLHVAGGALVTGALGFGSAVRQMVNLWGTGYGLGVQSSTLYLRSDANFAFYRGGSHNDAQLNEGGGTALATLTSDGTLTAGAYRFGNNSVFRADQGGSLELGGDNGTAGTGTPYIDFHYAGLQQDYNARIINDANGQLTVHAGTFAVRDCFAVSLACADFLIGHSSRRKTPGRALVDGTSILYINYDGDWSGGITYWGALTKASTRDIKEDVLTLDAPDAASLLQGLEPVRYRLIGDESRAEHMGFIAEDVPDAIAGPDHRTINESHVVAVLTRVVKEQQRRLDTLTHRLEGLSHA